MLLSKDWEGLSQALVPEIRQLVSDWDKLSNYQREERTGHAVGKLGFDIIAPGALAKALAKGVKGVEALKAAYQNLQAAKEVYLIEALTTAERQALGITHKAETALVVGERGGSTLTEAAQLKGVSSIEDTTGVANGAGAFAVSKKPTDAVIQSAENVAVIGKAEALAAAEKVLLKEGSSVKDSLFSNLDRLAPQSESQALGITHKAETASAIVERSGISAAETAQLKGGASLLDAVGTAPETFTHNPLLKESYELFKSAEKFLKPYTKTFMPEKEVRGLIQRAGIPTFSRPSGIPENFKVRITDKSGGMEYVHPKNPHTRVRVMPGKPHSPLPHQQKPYVTQMKNGKNLDKNGNIVLKDSPNAHIPLDEFICSIK